MRILLASVLLLASMATAQAQAPAPAAPLQSFDVPASGKAQTVYILDQHGQPQAVPVKTGISDANQVEITGGNLAQGQEVIAGTVTKPGASGSQSQGSTGTRKLGF